MTFNVLKKLAEQKSNAVPPQEQPDWAHSQAKSISDFINKTVPILNDLEEKIKALPDLSFYDIPKPIGRLSKEHMLGRIQALKQTGIGYPHVPYGHTYTTRELTAIQEDYAERLEAQSSDLGYKAPRTPDHKLEPLSDAQEKRVRSAIAQAINADIGVLTDHNGNDHPADEVTAYQIELTSLNTSPGVIVDNSGPEDANLEEAIAQIKIGLKNGEPYVAEPEYNEVQYDYIKESTDEGPAYWVSDTSMIGRGERVPIPLALVDLIDEIIYVDPKALGKLPNPTQVTMGSFINLTKLGNMMEQGLSAGMSVEDIAKKHNVPTALIKEQLQMGIKVEKEHTDDENVARKIALDHLTEDPKYYSHLKEMEEKYTGAAHG